MFKNQNRKGGIKHKAKVIRRWVRRSWCNAYKKAVRLIETELGYEIYGDSCLLR